MSNEDRLREISLEIKRLSLMRSAILRNKDFDLPLEHLKEIYNLYSDGCPCCYRPWRQGKGGAKKKAMRSIMPTVDRIDADVGYVKGNVQLLCNNCNLRKQRQRTYYPPMFGKMHEAAEGLSLYQELVDDLQEKRCDA